MNNHYFQQADFLLRILPIIGEQADFALKGGTAINFFFRELPRLSVDIDLTYLPIEERKKSFAMIEMNLLNIKQRIEIIRDTVVSKRINRDTAELNGLNIEYRGSRIKIEVNPVIRGCVYPSEIREITPTVQEKFEKYAKVNCLSFADIYGGKICAALDRQHPRDLFDILLLFQNEGLTDEIRTAFIVYLISHNRPLGELLQPNLLDIQNVLIMNFLV